MRRSRFRTPGPTVAAESLSDEALWKAAAARIEQHRKADAVVAVVNAAGKPVPGAAVRIEQTRHAFLFGSNIFVWGQVGNAEREAAYRKRFAELLNYATLPFYWPSYEPAGGQPGHRHAEGRGPVVPRAGNRRQGASAGLEFRRPLAGSRPTSTRSAACKWPASTTAWGRFAGLIDRWDVVNEATHFDRAEFLRNSPKISAAWQKLGRMEFAQECFVHARKANREATLVINDYRTDADYERVIEQLADATGKPMYDVIGIQSHMHGGTWTNRQIWQTCERFARFKVPLHFTETTILSGPHGWERKGSWPSNAEGETRQARDVVGVYTMLFSYPAVAAITWWDFSDLHAWQGAPAGLLRADMSPKPAYEQLMGLVKGKWWTTTSATTGTDGEGRLSRLSRGLPNHRNTAGRSSVHFRVHPLPARRQPLGGSPAVSRETADAAPTGTHCKGTVTRTGIPSHAITLQRCRRAGPILCRTNADSGSTGRRADPMDSRLRGRCWPI